MLHEAIALLALTVMEIVLGIDNIVFISIATSRLREDQQRAARLTGLGLAMGMRIALLLVITWIMGLTRPIFQWSDLGLFTEWFSSHREMNDVSVKDLILLGGGLFLIQSSVREIHAKVEGQHEEHATADQASFWSVIAQIVALDVIFSLDSVITAVGMAEKIWVMITAVVVAVGVMMVFSGKIAAFVEKHPTVKMLALSFLLLIGVMLVAEGIGTHISKGYIYFAMAFSLLVEVLNMQVRKRAARKAAQRVGAENAAANLVS
jgi:predicted tellurium resistance membrane protein TerC